jgi:anti-sigma factor RsiW
MESVPADPQRCPPDVEEVAEAYCMETLDRPARLAFEKHYLACARCASVVASTDEYVRSIRSALERLRAEEKDSEVTRPTGTP